MGRMIGVCIIAFVVASLPALARAQDATVTLKTLTETRELDVVKDRFSGWQNGIELKLHADGPAVQGARRYGEFKIEKAVDDTGTDLTTPGAGPTVWNAMHEVRAPMVFGPQKDEPKPTGFDFDLKLPTPSARSAKSMSLKATMQVLVGGEKKIITVKPIKANLGKTLDDPALAAVGVKITLVDPAKGAGTGTVGRLMGIGSPKGVTLHIVGDPDAIASVEIVDASGKRASHDSMSRSKTGVTNEKTITYFLDKPPTDDLALNIEVWPGQKRITVPIELKDVQLP